MVPAPAPCRVPRHHLGATHTSTSSVAAGAVLLTAGIGAAYYAGVGPDVTDEDLVWADTERVGTLEAGGTHTTTRRVELSLEEGLAVDAHGGWLTIVTTVRSDERPETFGERRQVVEAAFRGRPRGIDGPVYQAACRGVAHGTRAHVQPAAGTDRR